MGEGQGEGERSLCLRFKTCTLDSQQNAFEVVHNVVVPEAKDAESLIIKPGIPHAILILLLGMLTAIELNDKAFFKTDEIYNIGSERLLPFEFQTGQTRGAQVFPEELLRIGRSFSQVSSKGGV